jgi:hypothetical protein
MSVIKKADVKNHLSTRRKKLVFPFAPVSQPDATGYSGDEHRDTNPSMAGSGNPVETSAVKKQQA